MPVTEAARTWSLSYRLLTSVIAAVAPDLAGLGLDPKELFLLAELDAHPYPAELAGCMSMPKPTVTVYVKRLEAAGLVRRDIDPTDLRRHRLQTTPAGRKALTRGLAFLSTAFEARLGRLTSAEQATFARLLEKMS